MIKQDSISIMMTIVAVAISLYLATYELGVLILFPLILLFSGLILQILYMRRMEYTDHIFEEETSANITYYTMLAFIGILMGSLFANFVRPQFIIGVELSIVSLRLFAALMAICEEQFFRGFFTNFFLKIFNNPYVAAGLSGVVFAIYHFRVYGTSNAFFYVIISGFALSYVAIKSGRLSPCILAHVINNILAV